jgi:threonine dehydrogenase-like Zn-dependent dehydrogenase
MQAVIFPAPSRVTLEQVADPPCGIHEVIVQVTQVGICGTDLHIPW